MRKGFSLVELSIVLVILGLLTGGILAGQSLIRAAELRSVVTEFQAYQTAVMTFRDKYFALPGDMRNATDFWGAMSSGTCPNATGGTDTQTCNGDGNGIISGGAAANQTGEMFTFWQHLANSGLIEGNYTGIAGTNSAVDANISENIPSSKLGQGGWTMYSWGILSGNAAFYDGNYNNSLAFGSLSGGSAVTTGLILKPEEAWGIDKKVDDGLPSAGTIRVPSRITCTTQSDGTAVTSSAGHAALTDAQYNLSDATVSCALVFKGSF